MAGRSYQHFSIPREFLTETAVLGVPSVRPSKSDEPPPRPEGTELVVEVTWLTEDVEAGTVTSLAAVATTLVGFEGVGSVVPILLKKIYLNIFLQYFESTFQVGTTFI